MKMSPREIFALRDYLDPNLKDRALSDARRSVSLTDIADQTCLGGRLAELSGRSVLLAVDGQFLAGLAMIEIDGIARRMLLCPPDLSAGHLPALVEDAEIDAVVTDQPDRFAASGVALVVPVREDLQPAARAPMVRPVASGPCGRRSMTSAAMAVCRFSSGRLSAVARWSCPSPASPSPLTSRV
jgi:hypothetical protein